MQLPALTNPASLLQQPDLLTWWQENASSSRFGMLMPLGERNQVYTKEQAKVHKLSVWRGTFYKSQVKKKTQVKNKPSQIICIASFPWE